MGRRVIVYELNEVPLRIVDAFMGWQPNSFLARRAADFQVWETSCEDEGPLSPWVTWPTLQRGVTDTRHGIRHFGQDLHEIDRRYPPIWSLLCAHGVSTGVFGSLHTYPLPENVARYAFYVPDTFASGPECHPDSLSTFQAFNLAMARESARNVSSDVPWAQALRFLLRAPALGLRAATIGALARQILDERRQPIRRVRRRTYQTVLAFDFFVKLLEQKRPEFCTFFTNHVASSMHRYWAARFPDDYGEFEYPTDWVERFSGEIEFTMGIVDAEVARLAAFVEHNPDYVLWVTSSMGQAPTKARVARTQTYVRKLDRFMARLGFDHSDWEQRPAMDPDVNVVVTPEKTAQFVEAVSKLEVNGSPVRLDERENGFFNIGVVGANVEDLPPYARFGDEQVHFDELGLENVEIEDQAGTSAYHIPEGSLLVFDPRGRGFPGRKRVSTLALAPFLLRNFGAPVPSYMRPDEGFAPF